MKICKKCEKEFSPSKGLLNYCSLSCRNSREQTDEIRIKKSESAKKSEKVKTANLIRKYKLDFVSIGEKISKAANEKILNEPFYKLSFGRLRKRIVLEQENKCNLCGISIWNNKPITLELEHKDGNNQNNSRDNLECLCPNCHSQTDTWRGKNKKEKRDRVSDDKLINCLLETKNIRQALLKLGLSPKGGNYKRVHGLVKKYSLEFLWRDNSVG